MSQKIKIAAIEVKEGSNDRGPWKSYLIHGEDKAKFSTFDPSAGALKVGDILDAEVEVKGKFVNLKSFTVTGHAAEPPAPSEKPAGAYHDDREDRTDIRTAVMQTAALWTAGKLTEKDAEVIGLRKWLTHLLCLPVTMTTSAVKSGQGTVSQPKVVADYSPQVKSADIPFPVDDMLQRICERLKFGSYATARKWLLDQCGITDEMLEKDPEEAWNTVKAMMHWE